MVPLIKIINVIIEYPVIIWHLSKLQIILMSESEQVFSCLTKTMLCGQTHCSIIFPILGTYLWSFDKNKDKYSDNLRANYIITEGLHLIQNKKP